mmetsp:Transcript_78313/g.242812  ORF Transcript_78313/g.242812 Transcript_78313/m.242812 type:complete len:228 (-) Transcript_78313:531-1214(-)
MVADAPDVLLGLRVAVHGPGPREHVVTVVVPHHELEIHAAGVQRGAQVVPDEVALLLVAVEAVLPRRRRVGLVLHGEAPEVHPLLLELPGETNVEVRPGLAILRQQAPARLHPAGVFHPSGRAPRTREQRQGPARGGPGALDHGDHTAPVLLDGERLQLRVTGRVHAAPVASGEVASVHVQTPQGVAQARLGVEVGVQDQLLVCRAHLQKDVCGGLRERSPKAREVW